MTNYLVLEHFRGMKMFMDADTHSYIQAKQNTMIYILKYTMLMVDIYELAYNVQTGDIWGQTLGPPFYGTYCIKCIHFTDLNLQ